MAPPRRPDHEPVESRRAQRHQRKVAAKRRRLLIAGAVAFAVAVVAIVVVVAARDDDESEEESKQLLLLDEYSITGSLIVQPGDVSFGVANVGEETHNVGVRGGPITADLPPGQASGLELRGLQPGTYELYCDIIGHAERGMVATLQVLEPGDVPTPPTT